MLGGSARTFGNMNRTVMSVMAESGGGECDPADDDPGRDAGEEIAARTAEVPQRWRHRPAREWAVVERSAAWRCPWRGLGGAFAAASAAISLAFLADGLASGFGQIAGIAHFLEGRQDACGSLGRSSGGRRLGGSGFGRAGAAAAGAAPPRAAASFSARVIGRPSGLAGAGTAFGSSAEAASSAGSALRPQGLSSGAAAGLGCGRGSRCATGSGRGELLFQCQRPAQSRRRRDIRCRCGGGLRQLPRLRPRPLVPLPRASAFGGRRGLVRRLGRPAFPGCFQDLFDAETFRHQSALPSRKPAGTEANAQSESSASQTVHVQRRCQPYA